MAVYYIGNRDRYGVLWPATTIARLCPCPDTLIFASGYPEKIITAIHLLHATTYKSINDNPGFAIYPNHTPLHENLLPSCERYTPLKGVSFGLSLNSTWMKMVSNPPRNIASTLCLWTVCPWQYALVLTPSRRCFLNGSLFACRFLTGVLISTISHGHFCLVGFQGTLTEWFDQKPLCRHLTE